MTDADLALHFATDTRCGNCAQNVGFGVQCSLCHRWYHLGPDDAHASAAAGAHAALETAGSPPRDVDASSALYAASFNATVSSTFHLPSDPFGSPGPASPSSASLPVPRGDGGANGNGGGGGSAACPGICSPQCLPYFCGGCQARCAKVEMRRVTDIFEALAAEERDEMMGSASPVFMFGTVTASFVRKRVRAAAQGPQCTDGNDRAPDAASHHQYADGGGLFSPDHHHVTKTQERRNHSQITQLRWERLFERQTLMVLRRVLGVVYPLAYDAAAVIAAAKAARSRRRDRRMSNLQALGVESNELELHRVAIRNKFFAPIAFVGPSAVDDVSDSDAAAAAAASGGGGGGDDALAAAAARRRRPALAALEQDAAMMDMQHESTVHRLRWLPGESGQPQRDAFGPKPVYVNPIGAQIRLSEVVIEMAPDGGAD